MSKQPIRIWPLGLLALLVCSLWNFAGGFFGLVGIILWTATPGRPDTATGILLGGGIGLAGGVVWCVPIVRAVLAGLRKAGRAPANLAVRGMLWGGGLGAACAALTEAGLAFVAGTPPAAPLAIGLGAGAAAGAVLGLLGGLLAVVAARWTPIRQSPTDGAARR